MADAYTMKKPFYFKRKFEVNKERSATTAPDGKQMQKHWTIFYDNYGLCV